MNAESAAVGIAVPASLAFDYPTQNALAAHISNELAAKALVALPAAAVGTPHQHEASATTALVSLACQYPEAETSGKSQDLNICQCALSAVYPHHDMLRPNCS